MNEQERDLHERLKRIGSADTGWLTLAIRECLGKWPAELGNVAPADFSHLDAHSVEAQQEECLKLYIASLFALRVDENGNGFTTSHTVSSCVAPNTDEAHQQLLDEALQLYPISEGYQGHSVALSELLTNVHKEEKQKQQ